MAWFIIFFLIAVKLYPYFFMWWNPSFGWMPLLIEDFFLFVWVEELILKKYIPVHAINNVYYKEESCAGRCMEQLSQKVISIS